MDKIKLGLQAYSVRAAFGKDPADTFKRVADMGYECMELNCWTMKQEPQYYVDALAAAGLECCSCMADWDQLVPDKLEETIAQCKGMGVKSLVIGMVDPTRLKEDPAYPREAVDYMNYLLERFEKEGISTGYHSHDIDSIRVAEGKSFYDMVMENTPERFSMVMDTGNTWAGSEDPVAYLKRYSGRSPILHLKGYGKETGYMTALWESDGDWKELLTTAMDRCGTKTMIVEFGKRGDYDPFDCAEKSLHWLKGQLQELGRL